jgi:hypothetical protein
MALGRVLLIELNEITWELIELFMAQGKAPNFAALTQAGVRGAPMSVDLPPQLDPWITWTTLYTGRTQEAHNVFFLEQPPETIRAKRLWEICAEAGLSVGVFGSVCSWPPQKVKGFYVPNTFAPDSATFPEALRPIQDLNLTYTRAIRLPAEQDSVMFKLKLGAKLAKLGLRPATLARLGRQLAVERRQPHLRWRRVALQPLVNCDFFSKLYRRSRPAFATFHSNHVAHYMHTYWKAFQPERFPQETPPEEVRKYGGAIEHGYRIADELLGRIRRLLDPETTLVVASSMGQKPYVNGLQHGRPINQLRSPDKLLELLKLKGRVRALPTMSDQFNLYADSPADLQRALTLLERAYIGQPGKPLFRVYQVENSVTVNLKWYDGAPENARCYFPDLGEDVAVNYSDLVYNSDVVKSGTHDPRGTLLLYGRGVRPGVQIAQCNNLDIAPTLLTLLGLPVPEEMTGRVLQEALA